MTPDKQKQKLAGQTSIAQKVFQFVPVEEQWTPLQIAQAMQRATSSRIDMHILRGCLNALTESGLVRVIGGSVFQRIAAHQSPLAAQPKPETAPVKAPSTKPTEQPASAIDLLAGIAKTLRTLAGELESAALAIEEGKTKEAEELGKLRQLQALLKGLG